MSAIVCTLPTCGDPIVDAVRVKLMAGDHGDIHCAAVADKLAARSKVGQEKYNQTLTRSDLSGWDWLKHAQEEAMDLANYLEVLIQRSPVESRFNDLQEMALATAAELENYLQQQ
jgi:hypothetical protein